MRQCGFSVAAFILDLGRMNIARELIDDGYKAEKYRSAYDNPDFRIRPPSIHALEEGGASQGKAKKEAYQSNRKS